MATLIAQYKQPARDALPNKLLRLEGLAELALAVALYAHQGFNWWLFALLLLAPDLAAAAYAFGQRPGSAMYNLAHTTAVPVLLALVSLAGAWPLGLQLALIWLAHIGMDRAIGYGLKYADSPRHTHLSDR